MYGLKMIQTWDEMSEEVRVETSVSPFSNICVHVAVTSAL